MKLISSYDNSWEEFEPVLFREQLDTAKRDLLHGQMRLSNDIRDLANVIEDAQDLSDLELADSFFNELRAALGHLRNAKANIDRLEGLEWKS